MNKNLDEISDGKVYSLNDMVRAACNDCEGCSACCEDMGQSVILDPLDLYNMEKHLNVSFEQLLADKIELNIADGMILPNLKMTTETNVCPFLNEQGRCGIHAFRPGICRVFPLGRIYEENRLQYFLQMEGCQKTNRSKVKVEKWLDTKDLKRNQQYLIDWHDFRKKMEVIIADTAEEQTVKTITLFLLNTFFQKPYDKDSDFYPQFYERMNYIKSALNI